MTPNPTATVAPTPPTPQTGTLATSLDAALKAAYSAHFLAQIKFHRKMYNINFVERKIEYYLLDINHVHQFIIFF